jgi:Tfp pilus assembly pilus retraction ATPase PilT
MANPTVAPDHEAVAPQRAAFNFKAILQQMVQLNASDLHLKVGRPPTLRVNGDLSPLPLPALRPEDLTALAKELMTPKQVKEFSEYREADFATGVPGHRSISCQCLPAARYDRVRASNDPAHREVMW